MARALSKEQRRVIYATVFGNVLGWFEVYSFAYLAPILSRVFFNSESYEKGLLNIFLTFGFAFIIRPIGSIVFGRIGDLIGRKFSFILSIVVLSLPTFLMGFIPSYEKIGLFAPLLLVILRASQAMASSGEVAGTVCFLYEYAGPNNKRFMTSWTGVGNQIGAILAVIELFFLEQVGSEEFLLAYGWRISFWTGGILGFLSFYLRRFLHETPVFKSMELHDDLDVESLKQVMFRYKKNIALGCGYCVLNASAFYMIVGYMPLYFQRTYGLSVAENAFVAITILVISTVLLPLFGKMGDRYNNRVILLICSLLSIVLLFPIYMSINYGYHLVFLISGLIYLIPISGITALLGYRGARLYVPQVRYTGTALGFSLADGVVGGFTPAISLYLVSATNNQAAFCLVILVCALISCFSFLKVKD